MKNFEYRFELSRKVGEGLFYETVKAVDYYDAEKIIKTLYPRIFIRKSETLNLHLNVDENVFMQIFTSKKEGDSRRLLELIVEGVLKKENYYFHLFINSHHTGKKDLTDKLFGKNVFSSKCFEFENNYESIKLYSAIKYFVKKSVDQKNLEVSPLRIVKIKPDHF